MAKYQFQVEGSALDQFPVDMLRYDACYPAHSESVDHITCSLTMNSKDKRGCYPKGIRIELVGDRKPTIDRWKSFGWEVLQCHKIGGR